MPKIIDHDQRRKDIIDVTWRLIVKGGIDAATMREIANEAGFANGALKHYFPGKDDIIQGTYERALAMMGEQVARAVGDKHGIEALRAVCLATAPLDEDALTAARVLLSFWERAVSNDTLHEAYLVHFEDWWQGLARYIAEGREAGEITIQRPDDELVDEIVLMNVGSTIMSIIAPNRATPELMRRHIDDFIDRLNP